jgi:two-component system response regulator FixJ
LSLRWINAGKMPLAETDGSPFEPLRAMSVSATPDLAQGPVFIVDGDGALRGSLKFALGIDGYDVEAYASAEAFLAAVRAPAADACLVVDYHLPGMNGIELIEQLAARGASVPAILIVTNPSPGLARRTARAGVALVEKPLLGTALLDQIRDALAHGSRAST